MTKVTCIAHCPMATNSYITGDLCKFLGYVRGVFWWGHHCDVFTDVLSRCAQVGSENGNVEKKIQWVNVKSTWYRMEFSTRSLTSFNWWWKWFLVPYRTFSRNEKFSPELQRFDYFKALVKFVFWFEKSWVFFLAASFGAGGVFFCLAFFVDCTRPTLALGLIMLMGKSLYP